MALGQRNPAERRRDRPLRLPPPYRPVALREAGDAFAYARANAARLGAGALVFVGRFDLAEFAVVLEPEEPLVAARLAFYAGMVALGDALAALAPPEKSVIFEWPGAILVDGGLVGGGRLGWPDPCTEATVPDWLVFGVMIRTSLTNEGGLYPLGTALEEEGFGVMGTESVAETFARYLMVTLDRWKEVGFMPLAQDYLLRLAPEERVHLRIDNAGDLLEHHPGRPASRRALGSALIEPTWLDAASGGPKL